MTFLSDRTLARESLRAPLSQRRRSSVEFLGALQNISSGEIRPRARHDFEADPAGARLIRANDASNEPWADSIAKARAVDNFIPDAAFAERLEWLSTLVIENIVGAPYGHELTVAQLQERDRALSGAQVR